MKNGWDGNQMNVNHDAKLTEKLSTIKLLDMFCNLYFTIQSSVKSPELIISFLVGDKIFEKKSIFEIFPCFFVFVSLCVCVCVCAKNKKHSLKPPKLRKARSEKTNPSSDKLADKWIF
jgi:hypothetical protein